MNANLEHLVVLQAQDLELAQLRQQATDAPRRVGEAEKGLRGVEQALAGHKAALAAEEKLRRSQESEIETQRGKMERLRRSLDAATSAAQVTAFERETTFARGVIEKLEGEAFASLERTEALEAEATGAQAQLAQRQQQLTSEQERAARVATEATEQIAGVEKQRRALRQEIDEAVLASYDRLSKAKGTAVAEALGNGTAGRCSACQMGIRPQRWQDLIGREHDDTIFACETCGRMLFWDPRRDTPKAWEIGDRLRRAQAGSAR